MAITPIENKWDKIPLCYPATFSGLEGFTDTRRVLEIGPGRGDFLFYLSENNPKSEIYAVELKSKRYFKLIDRITKRGLNNVKVIQADARQAVVEIFEPDTIDEIHINFPDPWPKRKHTKNRLVSKEFLSDCARILKRGGIVSFVTDSKDYADEVARNCSPDLQVGQLSPGLKAGTTLDNEIFPSYFAQKWLKEGRKFYRFTWRKT